MPGHGIPTAAYERFRTADQAKAYVRARGAPIVVKADGLAAGKGVVVAETLAEAEVAIDMILGGDLGAAGAELVIEEFLNGEEASFFALCDGETALPLASAQDHKRAFDGDNGPNTGGMGAYSPAPIVDEAVSDRVMAEIVRPTLRAMKASALPQGRPLCRSDDHRRRTKAHRIQRAVRRSGMPGLMPRLLSDLLPALLASRDGVLKSVDLRWYADAALTVVMAAKGYPGNYAKGSVIEGLDAAAAVEAWKSSMPEPDRMTGASLPMADAC